jgi:hypothetical protein
MLTAPETEPTPAPSQVEAPAPPSDRLAGPSILSQDITLPPVLPLLNTTWNIVTTQLVRSGEEATVTGERYELRFSKGSLSDDEVITIKDYDHDILDVELGPHGTKFGEPVTLSIDIRGTAADPGSKYYDQREPVVYWLNDGTNRWEQIPSTVDWARGRVEARLEHFSRYCVGGKAGWKGQPNREQE